MSGAGFCSELRGRTIRELLWIVEAGRPDQLDPAHVHRNRVTGLPADRQRAIPDLLGVQSAAARYYCFITGADHTIDVPAGSGWRFYFPECRDSLFSPLPIAGTAQDIPIHGGNHVLIQASGFRL